jgi:predicted acylesterase/phospholipase RssA
VKRFLIAIFCLAIAIYPAFSETQEVYPRIALVLSGGIVTRGLSEIGVIKALEEEHIPIAYVAGTSMGAVLGSLLAQGYTASEIEQIAKSIDWMQAFVQSSDYKNLLFGEKEKYGKYLLSLDLQGLKPVIPSSLVNEQKPSLLFTEISIRALNIRDFDRLKIPFRANATDLETGGEVALSSGYLPRVLQASAAVPMMLPPVEIEGKLLIDGGAVNNLPVNLVKGFHPDIVVAVNLGMELRKKEELNSIISIMSQNLAFLQKENTERNRKQADILIEPDVSRYSFADFGRIVEIIEIGYQAARQKMPALKQLIAKKIKAAANQSRLETKSHRGIIIIKNIYINGNTVYPQLVLPSLISSEVGAPFEAEKAERDRVAIWHKYYFDGYKLAEAAVSFESRAGDLKFTVAEGKIGVVRFTGRENFSEVFLKDKIRYQPVFNMQNVSENIDRLYSTGYFDRVGFTVMPAAGGYVLEYQLKEKNYNSLALGLRYDTYQNLSLLADLNLVFSRSQNFQQMVSLKIGNEYNYQFVTEFWPKRFGQNLLGEFAFFYFLKNQDLYTGSQLNSTFHYLSRGLRLGGKINIEPLGQIATGIESYSVSYERIFSLLADENITKLYIRTKVDFLDEPLFPKQGVAAQFEYQQALPVLGDNYDFSKAKMDLAAYLPLPWQHVVFAKGKVYLGKGQVPLSENYRLGGEENLVGFGRDQFIGKDLLQVRLGYRLPLRAPSPASGLIEGVYLSLLQDYGMTANRVNDLDLARGNAGYGAEFQFNTLLGLAARLNIGFGQGSAIFFAVGNEF